MDNICRLRLDLSDTLRTGSDSFAVRMMVDSLKRCDRVLDYETCLICSETNEILKETADATSHPCIFSRKGERDSHDRTLTDPADTEGKRSSLTTRNEMILLSSVDHIHGLLSYPSRKHYRSMTAAEEVPLFSLFQLSDTTNHPFGRRKCVL